jgi:hypothetical protein
MRRRRASGKRLREIDPALTLAREPTLALDPLACLEREDPVTCREHGRVTCAKKSEE